MEITGRKINFEKDIKDRCFYASKIEALLENSFEGVLFANDVAELTAASGIAVKDFMLELTKYAALYARPPISNFHVGAVAQGYSGNLYFGANIEFEELSLNMSVHGEQAATANAMAHGETGLISIAVNAAPCGHCRQFLYETNPTLDIFLGKRSWKLKALLPEPFGPKDLGIEETLLEPQNHLLSLDEEVNPVGRAALAAAKISYAPHSKTYAGVALALADGRIISGSYAENAAYNPSLSPLQAALASFLWTGLSYDAITDVVLVQVKGARASQIKTTENVLASISQQQLQVYQANLMA